MPSDTAARWTAQRGGGRYTRTHAHTYTWQNDPSLSAVSTASALAHPVPTLRAEMPSAKLWAPTVRDPDAVLYRVKHEKRRSEPVRITVFSPVQLGGRT